MKYDFKRELILNKEINDKCFEELECIVRTGNISRYTNWHWLANVFKEVLEYNEYGYNKPAYLINKLFIFRDEFSYSGKIYRGYNLEGFEELPILKTNDICSWSSKYDVASRFTEKSEGLWCVLSCNAVNGFDLASFMSYLLENCPIEEIYVYFEVYFGEDEVLYPANAFDVYKFGDRSLYE